MNTTRPAATRSSCSHDLSREAKCVCSDDIARFGNHGGWDNRVNRIGTLAFLRRMHASGRLSRRKLLAEMRLRGFSDEQIAYLSALIDQAFDEAPGPTPES